MASVWVDAATPPSVSFGLGASSSPNPVMRMGGISRGDGGEAARRERYSESVSPRSSSRSSRTSPLGAELSALTQDPNACASLIRPGF